MSWLRNVGVDSLLQNAWNRSIDSFWGRLLARLTCAPKTRESERTTTSHSIVVSQTCCPRQEWAAASLAAVVSVFGLRLALCELWATGVPAVHDGVHEEEGALQREVSDSTLCTQLYPASGLCSGSHSNSSSLHHVSYRPKVSFILSLSLFS